MCFAWTPLCHRTGQPPHHYIVYLFSIVKNIFTTFKLWTSTTSNVYLIRPRQVFWLSLVEEVMINPRDLRIKSGKSWRSHWSIKSIMYNRRLITLFPNKLLFLQVCYTSLLKTLREKEKLLVASNFSFSHSVFKSFGELGAYRMVLDLYKIDKWPKFSIDRR